MFNINFTPNTDNALFGFLYICVFLLLIFYYSFNLFNRKTEYKYKDLVVYSLFTLIFISSGYIYKYVYSKYNNINLNSSNDISTIYEIPFCVVSEDIVIWKVLSVFSISETTWKH